MKSKTTILIIFIFLFGLTSCSREVIEDVSNEAQAQSRVEEIVEVERETQSEPELQVEVEDVGATRRVAPTPSIQSAAR